MVCHSYLRFGLSDIDCVIVRMSTPLPFLGSTSDISLPGTGTALGKGLERVRFGWASGTYCNLSAVLYSPLTAERSLSHGHSLGAVGLKFFALCNQVFIGSFSLGMGGIPWVIMSEVHYLL